MFGVPVFTAIAHETTLVYRYLLLLLTRPLWCTGIYCCCAQGNVGVPVLTAVAHETTFHVVLLSQYIFQKDGRRPEKAFPLPREETRALAAFLRRRAAAVPLPRQEEGDPAQEALAVLGRAAARV
jgi:hypothetical protein